jgi:hypothetical protein
MTGKRHTEEQIIAVLKDGASGHRAIGNLHHKSLGQRESRTNNSSPPQNEPFGSISPWKVLLRLGLM